MILTKDNFKVYAAKYYENPCCFSEEEFLSDLNKLWVIKRLITKCVTDRQVNLRLLINNVITFYNCFERHAASKMLSFKFSGRDAEYLNAILVVLSLPRILDFYDEEFHAKIVGVVYENS